MAIVINSSTGEIDLNATTPGTYKVTYTTNGSCPITVDNTITINALDGATFAYSSNSLPQTGTASLTTTPTTSGGVFSAYPSGLSINSSTGEIDLAASTIQSYKIFYETSGAGCPNSSTFDLAVTAAGIANNYSMSFDGSNDYVQTSALTIGNTFTFSCWIKSNTTPSASVFLSSPNYYGAGYNGNFIIRLSNSTTIQMYSFDGTANSESSSATIPSIDTNWHHFTLTSNGTTTNIYWDGSPLTVTGNQTKSLDNLLQGLIIGYEVNFGNSPFNGKIDEVAIWNTALTSTQVSEIYNATGTNLTKDLTTVSGSNLKYWNRMGD